VIDVASGVIADPGSDVVYLLCDRGGLDGVNVRGDNGAGSSPWSRVRGFSLLAMRTILSGEADEIVELAKTNPRQVARE
jgi:hypothetical protein